MLEHITMMLALLGLLSLACQWLGWRLRLPAILPLLLCGLLLGPMFGVLNPDDILGDLLFPIISLGVAVILFEGALTLNFKEIKDHGQMVIRLVSIGTLITWCCISLATHLIMQFSWEISVLFGALIVVTGPTVIVPMLRSVRPKAKLASILRWEGIVIDPIGALLAVLVFEFIVVISDPTSHVLYSLFYMLIIGLGFGALSGFFIGVMLRNHWMPHYLRNTAVLTLMLAVYVASNLIQEESGLLTVTVMGIWLANMRGIDISDILEFKETLTVLLISGLFILLAARLDPNALFELGWEGLGVLLVVMFIARPISIWCCGWKTSLSPNDKWFLSWVAPRGIVAAAISSLFAIKLDEFGVKGAELVVPLVFLIIIGTVIAQSLTARFWARYLGVTADSEQGLLIFGASEFSRSLAKALLDNQINVILADSNWDNIRQARMDNIPVYFGNPASEHAEFHIDMTGIGRVLIISPYRQLNPLVSFHFQDMLGSTKVLGLTMTDNNSARHQLSGSYLNQACLFNETLSYSKLASLMARGAVIKSTTLTETFTYEDFVNRYGDSAMPLLYVSNGKLNIITTSKDIDISAGSELISLLPLKAQQHAAAQDSAHS